MANNLYSDADIEMFYGLIRKAKEQCLKDGSCENCPLDQYRSYEKISGRCALALIKFVEHEHARIVQEREGKE